MSNRHDISRLDDFIDGDLTAAEEKALLAELEQSEELRQELAAAKKLKSLMGRLPQPLPEDSYFDEVTEIILARAASISEDTPTPIIEVPGRRLSFVRIALPVAASILIFFGALSLSQSRQDESSIVLPLTEYQAITAQQASSRSNDSWHLSETELTEMSIGISSGVPGRSGGLASLSDVISVRWK